ncbi:hypothetical protein CRYUN_Cryun15aG0090800 [Craigia yunnanensis]
MTKKDDRILAWVEFRYERIYKVYKRYGIIGHSTPYCPHSNPDIERMINEQMEGIQRRFEFVTGYDLQEFLFTNNLKAFYNRGTERSTRVEFFSLNPLNNQPSNQLCTSII